MDAVKTLSVAVRRVRFAPWRWILVLLLGSALPIAGCVVFAASAGAALLTGLFVGRLQASLAATARSYQFTERGNVGLVFVAPRPTTITLTRFVGRLPAFHLVFIDLKQSPTLQAQGDGQQAVLYDTDVEIDFTTSPPTFTGLAKRQDGDESIPLDELYSEVEGPFAEVTGPNEAGAFRLRISLVARTESGDELEYALVFVLQQSAGQSRIDGSVEIERTFTPAEGEPEGITGTGSVDARRSRESDLDDILNDNADPEPPPPPANENDNVGDPEPPPPPGMPPSACIPGLSVIAASAVDLFIEFGGRDALDLNADGEVTVSEVQDAINPVLSPYGFFVSEESAACIAELVN